MVGLCEEDWQCGKNERKHLYPWFRMCSETIPKHNSVTQRDTATMKEKEKALKKQSESLNPVYSSP